MVRGYENGISTRRLILDACKKLFLDKGFHDTSYDDICQEAHVNRGSIYYHFKAKENIRYEVLWEITQQNKTYAALYCDQERFHFLLATYILWHQILADARIRKFMLDYYKDYPAYTEKDGLSQYYNMLYKGLYGEIWDIQNVNHLAFASVYGHIMGLMQLAETDPAHHTALELFQHCIIYGNMILSTPGENIEKLWGELLPYIEKLPLSIVETASYPSENLRD